MQINKMAQIHSLTLHEIIFGAASYDNNICSHATYNISYFFTYLLFSKYEIICQEIKNRGNPVRYTGRFRGKQNINDATLFAIKLRSAFYTLFPSHKISRLCGLQNY